MALTRQWASSIAVGIAVISIYVLQQRGVIALSEVGAAVVAFIIAFIGAALWWGFGEDIERLMGRPKKSEELKSVGQMNAEKELSLLIKPLYLAFEKYPSSKLVDMLSYPAEMWKSVLVSGTFGDAKNKEFPGAEDTVNSMIDIMSQHRELAQPKLQEVIDQFLAMRRDRRERKGQYAIDWHPYYDDAVKVINEIAVLVRERYDALTSKKM